VRINLKEFHREGEQNGDRERARDTAAAQTRVEPEL
jgi:hypothetical protein